MSALFKSEISSLMRLVAQQRVETAMTQNQRERARNDRAARAEIDKQAILDTLKSADRALSGAEIGKLAGVNRQRTDRILSELYDQKLVNRRRRTTRRPDGEGMRNPYRYRIEK